VSVSATMFRVVHAALWAAQSSQAAVVLRLHVLWAGSLGLLLLEVQLHHLTGTTVPPAAEKLGNVRHEEDC
jgi:hypothetical protein